MMRDILPEDSEIAAVLPEYTERGDSTRLILRDGREILVDCTTRTTLRYLAEPIDCDLVLVPVKTREPRVPGDNTLAQVNVALAPRLVTEPQTAIEFPGGGRIPVLWSEKTLSAHIAEGRHIHADLIRDQQESVLRRLTQKPWAAEK